MGGNSFRSNGTCLFYRFQTSRQKRLAIDLSALKHLIWHNRDDCDEEVDGSKGDFLRWIDTSAMLSDCLTKTMTSGRSNETLSTVSLTRPTEESLAIKAKNFETTEGLRTDSPASDMDSHNIICCCCAQVHVSIHSCDCTNGYFQGQEIDRNLAVSYSS